MKNKKNIKNDLFEAEAKIRLQKRKRKHLKKYAKKRVIIPCLIVLFFIVLGLYVFINSLSFQSTDDAFVEGRFISVAPRVSGQVVSLKVNDNDFVKKGQLLLEIDSNDYENKVSELEQALNEAIANKNVSAQDISRNEADLAVINKNLSFTKKDFDRYKKLRANNLCTKQEYDVAQNAYEQSLEKQTAMLALIESSKAKEQASIANIGKIEAQLSQAKLNLSYTKIYAPQDGNISSRNVEEGNYVNIAQPLMSIVSPEVWVVANYKETQLTKMKKDQDVEIRIDTYPGKVFKGRVDSIQTASGAKSSLFPPENAVGSYIKVVQRIPVKIIFTDDISEYTIVPGMSVVPKVKIR